MGLFDALALSGGGVLSLVGGGGKSTLMVRLAEEAAAAGRTAVATTTTHISRAQGEAAGFLLLSPSAGELQRALSAHRAVCAAALCEDGKLGPPSPALLAAAPALADWVIAEADGARRLPVKAPAGHEPVLLPGGIVVAVAGLTALGQPIARVCHRPELAAAVLGVPAETALTPLLLARLITSEHGQFKGVKNVAGFRVLLNQFDAAPAPAAETAAEIRRLRPGCRIAAASLQEKDCVKEVY